MSYLATDIIAQGANADIDTSEEDIVVITDRARLTDTQATLFIEYSLGTNTSLTLRFYVLREIGGTWGVLPRLNESDGTLDAGPVIIDGSTPATPVVYEMPIPACMGLKITGQGAGGANTSVTITVLARSN